MYNVNIYTNIGVDFLNKASEYRVMPTVALRGLVVFPGMGITFDVGRTRSLHAIKAAMADDQQIFLVAQKDVRDDEPDFDKLFKIGTIAKISHILRLPNSDTVRVSVDGITRATMVDMLQCDPYLITDVKIRREISVKSDDKDYATALVRQTKDYFEDYAEVVPQMPAEIILDVLEKNDPGELADYIGSNIMLEYKKRQQILNEINQRHPRRRLSESTLKPVLSFRGINTQRTSLTLLMRERCSTATITASTRSRKELSKLLPCVRFRTAVTVRRFAS